MWILVNLPLVSTFMLVALKGLETAVQFGSLPSGSLCLQRQCRTIER